MLPGLALSALSAVAFLAAHGIGLMLVGRMLSGLSAGIFTGTATVAVVELAAPEQRNRATLLATVANIGGLGCGPLVAGLLAQYVGSSPLRLPFVVDLVLLGLGFVAVLLIPETVTDAEGFRLLGPTAHRAARGPGRVRPRLHRGLRRVRRPWVVHRDRAVVPRRDPGREEPCRRGCGRVRGLHRLDSRAARARAGPGLAWLGRGVLRARGRDGRARARAGDVLTGAAPRGWLHRRLRAGPELPGRARRGEPRVAGRPARRGRVDVLRRRLRRDLAAGHRRRPARPGDQPEGDRPGLRRHRHAARRGRGRCCCSATATGSPRRADPDRDGARARGRPSARAGRRPRRWRARRGRRGSRYGSRPGR